MRQSHAVFFSTKVRVYDKALSNSPHDRQYLDVRTAFINFSCFPNYSQTILAIVCNRQVK